MLRELLLKEVYDSEEDNILQDFYIPVLKNSISYDRAVGYFDAKVLTSAARGLSQFVDNGGYVRLIVGATLSNEEYHAISEGYSERDIQEKFESQLQTAVHQYDFELFRNQLNTLTWFIKHNRLDIKVAIRQNGIYHEKIGIFRDEQGDAIVFQGSANETNSALTPFNHESINVFKGWIDAFKGHFEPHVHKFEKLWADRAKGTRVVDVTKVAERVLSQVVDGNEIADAEKEIDLWKEFIAIDDRNDDFNIGPYVPKEINGNEFKLREHQRTALNEWKNNGFRGVFELATGAGKTITAIYGAVKIYESRKKLLLVISVPYQSLADQWVENLRIFNINTVLCYGGEKKWERELKENLVDFQTGLKRFVAVVVVDATLGSKSGAFRTLFEKLGPNVSDYFLFVGDECHHHGASTTFKALPQNSGLRMGLSATPDRGEEDVEGNENIHSFYGSVVSSYTLKDALDDKVLTPYDYHLVEVSLTPEECDEYIELSNRIGQLYARMKNTKDPSGYRNSMNVLLSKRSRLVNGTVNKPIALERLLQNLEPIKHSLFYCAEGNIDNLGNEEDEEQGAKQISVISECLHSLGWRTSQFTANEDKKARSTILDGFKNGDIDSLVAMKCLDEGIDVPACSTAFILASSKKPRQFVQRRGRILRRSEGKDKAVIYDFFVTLPMSGLVDANIERRLIISELKRINEFASLALNKGKTFNQLEDYLVKYDLMHYLT
jgi:superfamily II DNA or RNA helicase